VADPPAKLQVARAEHVNATAQGHSNAGWKRNANAFGRIGPAVPDRASLLRPGPHGHQEDQHQHGSRDHLFNLTGSAWVTFP
jgi:hypothetical protein